MFERIKELIVEELGVDESAVVENATFNEDLGADSLDLFELVMAFEDEFDVKIPVEVCTYTSADCNAGWIVLSETVRRRYTGCLD